MTVVASFTQTLRAYTVSFSVAGDSAESGAVSPAEIKNVPYGAKFSVSGNVITFTDDGDFTVSATATPASTAQYSYSFEGWSPESGTVTNNVTVEAEFVLTGFVKDEVSYQIVDGTTNIEIVGVDKSLSAIVIPDSVTVGSTTYYPTSIASGAFAGSSATSLSIGSGVETIADGELRGLALESIVVAEDNDSYSTVYGVLCDKEATTLIRAPVSLLRIIIPDTVKTIADGAFQGTSSFRYLVLPSSVEYIGEDAFRDSSVSTVKFLGNDISIGANAFAGCSRMGYVLFPESFGKVDATAFDCTFHDENGAVVEFSTDAMAGHKYTGENASLDVYVPPVNGSIRDGTYVYRITSNGESKTVAVLGFDTDVSVKDVVLASSVKYLGFDWKITLIKSKAFMNDTGIESVKCSASIGNKTFAGCTGLKSVEMTEGATSIGMYAFFGCTSLGTVNLGPVVKVGTSAFSGCSSLENVDLSGVKTIGKYAFRGCALTVAVLDSARTIGYGAFSGNALDSVTFGTNLKSLNSKAFCGYSFFDADGGKLARTIENLSGQEFAGADKVLTMTS